MHYVLINGGLFVDQGFQRFGRCCGEGFRVVARDSVVVCVLRYLERGEV